MTTKWSCGRCCVDFVLRCICGFLLVIKYVTHLKNSFSGKPIVNASRPLDQHLNDFTLHKTRWQHGPFSRSIAIFNCSRKPQRCLSWHKRSVGEHGVWGLAKGSRIISQTIQTIELRLQIPHGGVNCWTPVTTLQSALCCASPIGFTYTNSDITPVLRNVSAGRKSAELAVVETEQKGISSSYRSPSSGAQK